MEGELAAGIDTGFWERVHASGSRFLYFFQHLPGWAHLEDVPGKRNRKRGLKSSRIFSPQLSQCRLQQGSKPSDNLLVQPTAQPSEDFRRKAENFLRSFDRKMSSF
jgi:hypothetical protein